MRKSSSMITLGSIRMLNHFGRLYTEQHERVLCIQWNLQAYANHGRMKEMGLFNRTLMEEIKIRDKLSRYFEEFQK